MERGVFSRIFSTERGITISPMAGLAIFHCLRMCDTKGSVFDKMLLVDDNGLFLLAALSPQAFLLE